MSYESVDALQEALTEDVFHYAKDRKKAAGRALGTLVEIINFYLLKTWSYGAHVAIERRVPEYANNDLVHNVEFTLHPVKNTTNIHLAEEELPFSAKKILKKVEKEEGDWSDHGIKSTQLLSKAGLVRNSCTIYEQGEELVIASLGHRTESKWNIYVANLHVHPFAIFECKRVGVEEGVKKGPQTIEKAKQGAYVARAVSSLQRVRMSDGSVYGALHLENGELRLEPYEQFLKIVINSDNSDLLRHFILTVGVVSNHGNWFTSGDQNKELRVLAQSYDWLLFLTDAGLAKFVEDLLLNPSEKHKKAREAFMNSYTGHKVENQFTKVKVLLAAHEAIQQYFMANLEEIEGWFNIISPAGMAMAELKKEIDMLATKNWQEILK